LQARIVVTLARHDAEKFNRSNVRKASPRAIKRLALE
jgi:hypothetical protein